MRLGFAIVAALFSFGAPASAEDSTELTKLMTAYDARGWEAVGRINIGRGGMCTGALISARVVLTAGHCLFDRFSGKKVDPSTITFHAGWRNNRAAASRSVSRVVVHPDYNFTGPETNDSVAYDLAILELDSEIRLSNVEPFTTGPKPRKGQQIGVVSYAQNREESPSLQEVCHVLARQRGALVMSCSADFGASGAPVFTNVDGKPQIVSVVSAMAVVRDRQVSLGTSLEKPLSQMLALLRSGGGTIASGKPKLISSTKPRQIKRNSGTGAKFLRP